MADFFCECGLPIRPSDIAGISNRANRSAKAELAALRAQLAERDAEVRRLREAIRNYLTAMDGQALSRFPMTGYTAKHLNECLEAMRAALKGEG